MGIASMVLGIVTVLIAWIPFCGWVSFLPAVAGLVLGIIDIVSKHKLGKVSGMGIAGVICSSFAIIFNMIYLVASIYSFF